MAYGDKGKYRFRYGGLVFNVDGESPEAAAAELDQKIRSGEVSLADRATRLGLTGRDYDVIQTREATAARQRASGVPVDADADIRGVTNVPEALEGVGIRPIAALKNMGSIPAYLLDKAGVGDPVIPLPDAVARPLVGIGRTPSGWVSGAQQIVGGAETEQRIAKDLSTENDIYRQFGEGFGSEDIGEAVIPVLAFYATGGLTGGSVLAAGATGATLKAVEGQTDPSMGGRALSGARGFIEGVIGQAAGNVLLKRLAGNAMPAAATPASRLAKITDLFKGSSYGPGGWRVYFGSIFKHFRNPATSTAAANTVAGMTDDATQVVANAASAAREGVRSQQAALQSRLGKEVLDKIEVGIRSLPVTERAGATEAVQKGLFQGVLKASIEEAPEGGFAVLNPVKYQQAMADTVGRLSTLFKHPGHAQIVTDMNALVRAMADQKVAGVVYTEQSVKLATEALRRAVLGNADEAAAAALNLAPAGTFAQAETDAVKAALAALAKADPGSEAQKSMIQVIIDHGRMAMGAAGERTGEETGDYVETKLLNVANKVEQWGN